MFNHQNDSDFAKTFDDTLRDIANDNNDVFSVKTEGGAKITLFEPISNYISDPDKRNDFCRAVVNKLVEFSFEEIFVQKFDYIVSNPPFKLDFSDYHSKLTADIHKKRFFAGVPNIPKKDVDKMAIYLLFIQHIIFSLEAIEDFSVVVSYDEIKEKNYSLSAGQYFDIKIEYVDITPEEFEKKMKGYKDNLTAMFAETAELEKEIMKQLEGLEVL